MAINAQFRADFSDFNAAVQKADKVIQDFSKNVEKVPDAMKKIQNSLQGTQMIKEATMMAEAVAKIGGVSMLTEKELQKLGAQATEAALKMAKLGIGVPDSMQKIIAAVKPTNAALQAMQESLSGNELIENAKTMAEAVAKVGGVAKLTETELQKVAMQAQEAAAKMRVMGIGVPENLQKLAAAAKPTETAFTGIMSAASNIAGAVGIGFSVGAVINFGKELFATADAIQKMADQTGLTAEEVQRLQYIETQTGTATSSMVSAIQNLNANLGSNDVGTIGAIRKLNINLDDFRTLGAYDQMTKLASAIADIKDPTEQANRAAEVFGKNWKELLPAIKQGMKEVGDAADVMKDHTVSSLARSGDAWEKFYKQLKNFAADALVAVADGFEAGNDKMLTNQQILDWYNKNLPNIGKNFKDMGEAAKGAAKVAAELANQRLKDVTAPNAAAAAEQDRQTDALQKKLTAQLDARKKAVAEQAAYEQRINEETSQRLSKIYDNIQKDFDAMMKNHMDKLKATNQSTVDYVAALTRLREVQHEAFGASMTFLDGINNIGKGFIFSKEQIEQWLQVVQFVGPTLADAKSGVQSFGQTLATGLTNDLKNVPGTIVSAITGGGEHPYLRAGVAIGSQIGSTIGKTIGTSISDAAKGLGSLAGPIGAAIGSLAGPLIEKIANFGGPSKGELEGRKLVAEFEKGFKDSAELLSFVADAYRQVGKTADDARRDVKAMWDAEKKGADATAAAIGKVSDVIEQQKHLAQQASRFGPSKAELQTMAQDAADVYEFMRKSGQYSAEQIAEAFKASQEAQAASLGINTEAQKKHLKLLEDGLKDLTQKRDALWEQISAEAPEEVMGVIETAQRAQLKVMDEQIAAQKKAIEKEAADAAEALEKALENIKPDVVHIPYKWVPQNDLPTGHNFEAPEVHPQARGGDWLVTRPTLFLAGERGPERATFTPVATPPTRTGSSDIAALSAMLARLPRAISRAVRDGVVGLNG